MKDYGISESDFNENLDFIAHNAIIDACTGSNPREITEEEIKKLLQCMYSGQKVNF